MDHDMALTDDDLAVLVMGDPITLDNVRSVTTDHVGDAVDVNPRTFVVTLSATTDETPVNVVLTSRPTGTAHGFRTQPLRSLHRRTRRHRYFGWHFD